MRTEDPEMHKQMNVELYPACFLWPSSRLSTISPWRAHKLSIALSLQDTHTGEVQPLLFTFYLFPLPCARLAVLPPSSFMYSSPPLPLCHLPKNLPLFSFLSLSCYKIHSVNIFHLSVFHCLYQCCSLSVCRLSVRL